MTPEDDGDITIYPELAAVDEMECIGWQAEYEDDCDPGGPCTWGMIGSYKNARANARGLAFSPTGRIRRVYAGAPIRINDNEDTTEFP